MDSSESANFSLWVKASHLPVEHSHINLLTCLWLAWILVAKLVGVAETVWSAKQWNIYYVALYRRNLLTCDLCNQRRSRTSEKIIDASLCNEKAQPLFPDLS